MTKKDMAKAIAGEMGLTQGQAQGVVQRVLDGITETLLNEGRIELRNFGVFEVKKRRPRRAEPSKMRDPRTFRYETPDTTLLPPPLDPQPRRPVVLVRREFGHRERVPVLAPIDAIFG